ncbi:hypothetical protein IFT48_02370 [Pseudomonas fluorescens]|uniref:hypothetical protein n=1 Tax=Pseudomonas fluorescens TaxID=294 RepID=UPI001930D341|nr:hypothetical protein [Pseudomonas fluorescens]MBD8088809.1 hypothetical protein [Pseudomonas fluorescens]
MSSNSTSRTTVLQILGIAYPMRDSQRIDFAESLVRGLGVLLHKPGHTLEFEFTRSPSTLTWGVDFEAPMIIPHNHVHATVKLTTQVGVGLLTTQIDERHNEFLARFRDALGHQVILSDEVLEQKGVEDQVERQNVELNTDGCAGGVQFEDMAQGLGVCLPWSMNLKIHSGADDALKTLRRSTRFMRWLRASTGLRGLDDHTQQLWDEVPFGDQNQLAHHTFSLSTWGSNRGESLKNATIIDSHLSNTPAASIAHSKVISIAQAALLMPVYHLGSPWKMDANSVPFIGASGSIFPFEPGSSLLPSQCELVYDAVGKQSQGYHVLVNHALCASGVPPERLVAIDFEDEYRAREEHLHNPWAGKIIKLDLGTEQAVNLLDTPLGVRTPSQRVIEDLACLLELLGGHSMPSLGWYNLSCDLAKQAFDRRSLSAYPNAYFPGADPLVDSSIDLLGDDHPATWWEVSEQLMNLGFVAEALKAHARAVPSLHDIVQVMRSGSLNHRNLLPDGGERLLRNLESLLADKPCFGLPTQLRVNSSEPTTILVGSSLSVNGLSLSAAEAIQYLVARKVATEGMFESFVPDCEGAFKSHHEQALGLMQLTRKVSYFGLDKVLAHEQLFVAIRGDFRSARMHGVSLSATTAKMDDRIRDIMSYAPVFAAFGLSTRETPAFEQSIQESLENHRIPSDLRSEDGAFFFKALSKTSPHSISQVLFLPKIPARAVG